MNVVTLHSQLHTQENPLQRALNPSQEPGKLSLDFATFQKSSYKSMLTPLQVL